jgi:3'-phosphoadenosine 5'-phosphosulfate sulfotransferase (PAPS reductase)/FAD synthetase
MLDPSRQRVVDILLIIQLHVMPADALREARESDAAAGERAGEGGEEKLTAANEHAASPACSLAHLGDTHTTRKWEPGMAEEETRFFGLKRECGLHEG